MKLAAVIQPQSDVLLQLLAQLGVEDWVYYDMRGMPTEFDGLESECRRAAKFGVRLSAIEGGPAIDRIVLGLDGRDAQIEQYKRSIGHMGRLGIGTLCYNFMPQILDDAMVIRTSSIPSARNMAPNFPLPADHIGAGRPASEALSGEYAWKNVRSPVMYCVPLSTPRFMTSVARGS